MQLERGRAFAGFVEPEQTPHQLDGMGIFEFVVEAERPHALSFLLQKPRQQFEALVALRHENVADGAEGFQPLGLFAQLLLRSQGKMRIQPSIEVAGQRA